MSDNKEKRSRFKRIASKRVENLIKDIRTLSNCSNTGNYEYTEEEVDKMIKAIRDEIKVMELLFRKNLNKNKKDTFNF
jgi:hypothetical protein